MLARNGEHENGANGGDDGNPSNDQTLPLRPRGDPAAAHDGNDLYDAKGDVEQDGLEAVVPERLDDQVTERRDTAAGDASHPQTHCQHST